VTAASTGNHTEFCEPWEYRPGFYNLRVLDAPARVREFFRSSGRTRLLNALLIKIEEISRLAPVRPIAVRFYLDAAAEALPFKHRPQLLGFSVRKTGCFRRGR